MRIFLEPLDKVSIKVSDGNGGDLVTKVGTIVEIAPARVFRERGIKLSNSGKHCKISCETKTYYKRINTVLKLIVPQEGR